MSKKTIVLLVLLNCIVFNTSSVGAYNPINAELDTSDLRPIFLPSYSIIIAEILEVEGDT